MKVRILLFVSMAMASMAMPAHADIAIKSQSASAAIDAYCAPLGSRPALSQRSRHIYRDALSAMQADLAGWSSLDSAVRARATAIIEHGRSAC